MREVMTVPYEKTDQDCCVENFMKIRFMIQNFKRVSGEMNNIQFMKANQGANPKSYPQSNIDEHIKDAEYELADAMRRAEELKEMGAGDATKCVEGAKQAFEEVKNLTSEEALQLGFEHQNRWDYYMGRVHREAVYALLNVTQRDYTFPKILCQCKK